MNKTSQMLFAIAAASALAGFSACGGDDDDDTPTVDVECLTSADCAGRTDGKTTCDPAQNICVSPTQECSTSADCAERDDGKTDCDPGTHTCVLPVTPPDPTSCTLDTECASNLCGADGHCATTKMVPCLDRPPSNATTLPNSTSLKVEVVFAGGQWSEAASCPWSCDNGFQLNEAKNGCDPLPSCTPETAETACRSKICGEDNTCATVKTDACRQRTADELTAAHAKSQDTSATATWNYVEYSDGSASWVTDGYCPLTECDDNYDLNEDHTLCSTDDDVCIRNEDCAGRDDGKIYCDVPIGGSSGVCITPECLTHEDCASSPNGKFCHNMKCGIECWYDDDCANDPNGNTICDSLRGIDSTWACVQPECEPAECSTDQTQYCVSGHWTDCPLNKLCALTGGEGITGTCQVPTSDECNPACKTTEFCRDNGESALERYTCEPKTSANPQNIPVVISQYYFGGYGNSQTQPTYAHAFLELYNKGSSDVDLSSLKLIKGTKAGSFSNWIDIGAECTSQSKSCTLRAGKYFRIRYRQTNSSALNTTMTFNLSKDTEKIAIDGSIALISGTPSSLDSCADIKKVAVDILGMNGAFCSETSPAAGVPGTEDTSNEGNRGTKSFQRDSSNADSGNNYYDFTAQNVVLHSIE